MGPDCSVSCRGIYFLLAKAAVLRTLCGEVPAPTMRICLALHLDAQRVATKDGERHQVVNVVKARLNLWRPATVISGQLFCSGCHACLALNLTGAAAQPATRASSATCLTSTLQLATLGHQSPAAAAVHCAGCDACLSPRTPACFLTVYSLTWHGHMCGAECLCTGTRCKQTIYPRWGVRTEPSSSAAGALWS